MQTALKRQKENEQVRHLRLCSSLDIPAVSPIRAESRRGARGAKAGGGEPRLCPHRCDRASAAGGSDAQVACRRGGADVRASERADAQHAVPLSPVDPLPSPVLPQRGQQLKRDRKEVKQLSLPPLLVDRFEDTRPIWAPWASWNQEGRRRARCRGGTALGGRPGRQGRGQHLESCEVEKPEKTNRVRF